MRVVFDPNVLVAALINPAGVPARLVRLWAVGTFDVVVSPRLLQELDDVLVRPALRQRINDQALERLLGEVRLRAIMVEDPPVVFLTRDPNDDYLPAMAEAAGADVLVSGDRDLTEVVDPPVRILTPRQALTLLEPS